MCLHVLREIASADEECPPRNDTRLGEIASLHCIVRSAGRDRQRAARNDRFRIMLRW